MENQILEQLQTELPYLEIQFSGGAICYRVYGFWSPIAFQENGKWKINEDVKKMAKNYNIFKELEKKLLQEDPSRYSGGYIVVNDENSRYFSETEDAALRARENQYSYCGRVDIVKNPQILILDDVEKPPGFNNLDDRVFQSVFSPSMGTHYDRTRRWLTVSLQLTEGRGFRREHFLLDTGSPISIIIREITADLVRENVGDDNVRIQIENVSVTFNVQSFNQGDRRTMNINLLGTDFLNSFVLIDDFASKSVMVLKRASPPLMRI